jgi:hypothetical protein
MNDFNVGEIMRAGKGVVDGGEKENVPFFGGRGRVKRSLC